MIDSNLMKKGYISWKNVYSTYMIFLFEHKWFTHCVSKALKSHMCLYLRDFLTYDVLS